MNRRWDELRKRAGLDQLRLHDLRHGCATFLQIGGVTSDATFPGRRERPWPALQRAALQCPWPAGAPRGSDDLGRHPPHRSRAMMLRLIPRRPCIIAAPAGIAMHPGAAGCTWRITGGPSERRPAAPHLPGTRWVPASLTHVTRLTCNQPLSLHLMHPRAQEGDVPTAANSPASYAARRRAAVP